jgi:ubiquitin C-terminal hydrolase
MIFIFSILILILILILIFFSCNFNNILKTQKLYNAGGSPPLDNTQHKVLINKKIENRGLKNVGYTCWLNSSIQLLNSLPGFNDELNYAITIYKKLEDENKINDIDNINVNDKIMFIYLKKIFKLMNIRIEDFKVLKETLLKEYNKAANANNVSFNFTDDFTNDEIECIKMNNDNIIKEKKNNKRDEDKEVIMTNIATLLFNDENDAENDVENDDENGVKNDAENDVDSDNKQILNKLLEMLLIKLADLLGTIDPAKNKFLFKRGDQHDSHEFLIYFSDKIFELYKLYNSIENEFYKKIPSTLNPFSIYFKTIIKYKLQLNDKFICISKLNGRSKDLNIHGDIESFFIFQPKNLIYTEGKTTVDLYKTILNQLNNNSSVSYNGYVTKDDNICRRYSMDNSKTLSYNTIESSNSKNDCEMSEIIDSCPKDVSNYKDIINNGYKIFAENQEIYGILPKFFIVMINRKDYNKDNGQSVKNNIYTDVAVEFEYGGDTYKLCSYICHIGGAGGGHYVCNVLEGNEIFRYSDSSRYSVNIIGDNKIIEKQDLVLVAYCRETNGDNDFFEKSDKKIKDQYKNTNFSLLLKNDNKIDKEYFINYSRKVRNLIMMPKEVNDQIKTKYAIPLKIAEEELKPIVDKKINRLTILDNSTNNSNNLPSFIKAFFQKKFTLENGHHIYEYMDFLEIDFLEEYKAKKSTTGREKLSSVEIKLIDDEIAKQKEEEIAMVEKLTKWEENRKIEIKKIIDKIGIQNFINRNYKPPTIPASPPILLYGFHGSLSGKKSKKKKTRRKKKRKKKKKKKRH